MLKKKTGDTRLISYLVNKLLRYWPRILMGLGGIVFLLPVVAITAYHLAYWGKVYPRVWVVDTPVSNRTEMDVEMVLQQRVVEADQEQPAVVFKYEGNEWYVLKAEIGFEYLPAASAREAYLIGRKGDLWNQAQERWRVWFRGISLPMKFSFDQPRLEARVASIAAELDIPIIPPSIEVLDKPDPSGSWVVVHAGESGQRVKQEKLMQQVGERLAGLSEEPILVPIERVELNITEEQIEKTRARAGAWVTRTLELSSGEQAWELKAQDLINFLDFRDSFSRDKVREYVITLTKAIDRPPQDAAFQFVEGRVTEFRPAKEGLELNQEQAVEDLLRILNKMETENKEVESVSLAIERTAPKVTLAEVNNLGIKELLGKGVSTYRGSIPGRVHNIGLASQRINGVLVPPGGTFSFNASVGEISAATGYQQAYVIRSGATILDDGGGVCQVSTTVFRAAINAGLPILERRAHSYRVGYYEQNAKAGLDATVYAPSVDLKFVNDTPGHILVQTRADAGSRTLTVEIYGTSDGRSSEIVNHRVWDIVPAPPPRYQDDPSLPAGTTKQIDYEAAGAKAKFDYVVKRGGEVIFSKTFLSNFQPWQAVYLRGTGG